MPNTAANLPAAKIINRLLRDYPLAQERLAAHAGARIDVTIGPVAAAVRITATGGVEAVGDGARDIAAVTFAVPLAALPQLLTKDEAAYNEITFEGDSELARVLSVVARHVEWDIEEDLSKLFGGGSAADIASHRIVGSARSLAAWGSDAGQRFTENVAEYLLHERDAFATKDELEEFMHANDTLRDDVARLEARLARLPAAP